MLAALSSLSARPTEVRVKTATTPTAAEDATVDLSTELLSIAGLVLGIVSVIVGIVLTHSAWLALGLLAVERLATSVRWKPTRRPVVGMLLALGGISASIIILIFASHNWWITLLIWFWYGDHVYKFFKGVDPYAAETEVKESTWDWAGLNPRAGGAQGMHETDDEGLVTEVEGEELAKLRENNEVLPEERVLAVVPLDDDHEKAALIFGTQHIYFPAMQHGEAIRCCLSYDSLPGRQFVNHGTGVYAGDGITLKPETEVNCEALSALLNAVRRAAEPGSVE